MTETTLNLRGLKCPLPALRTRKALKGLASGDCWWWSAPIRCPISTFPISYGKPVIRWKIPASADDVMTFSIRKK